ncbi:MAG: phenylacetate--CoA ligase family protein [Planctomycetota bacterium]|jgi:phenylacetate-CoA ligase
MINLLNKIALGVGAYWQARQAITRQFDSDAITRTQNARLKSLLRYSFSNIKYYQEVFKKAGVRPGQIETAQDLARLPILTRNALRERFWDFLPRDLPAGRISRTSGSTGVPICVLSDVNSRMWNSAAIIRYRRALGIGLVGGAILTPLKTANEPYRKEEHWTFLQGIHKTYYVNPYVDGHENAEYATRLLSRLKRPALIGITPAVRKLAHRVCDGDFPSFQPRAIMTVGESLTPAVRGLIESTFRAKVADIYACNEGGDVAWQCGHDVGYHLNADNVIVEVVKNNEPAVMGEVGEVVITNLTRYGMPVIRYKNGDLARLTARQCSCGCKLPMLAEIMGRTGEDILLPDGTTMPWNQLKSLMNHPHVRQFQLVQNRNQGLIIKYVAEKHADTKALEVLLLGRYRDLLGPSMAIETTRVSSIAPAPSGKSKLVVSQYKPRAEPSVPA